MFKIKIKDVKDGLNPWIESTKILNIEGIYDTLNVDDLVYVTGNIEKEKFIYRIFGKVQTSGTIPCSRCLKEHTIKLESFFNFIFLPFKSENDDDVFVYNEDDEYLNLEEPIINILKMEMPLRSLCSESCKGICPYCGKDLNEESCSCHIEKIDPRWEPLKKLL